MDAVDRKVKGQFLTGALRAYGLRLHNDYEEEADETHVATRAARQDASAGEEVSAGGEAAL